MFGLDLFSGIGGITKALEGYVRPVAYCENDRYAQGVLLSRMRSGDLPVAPVATDVRDLCGNDFADTVEIIYGGFPCQDISVAGRGAGLAGKRSGLFSEIVRLVSEIRPRFVFLENVPAIRTRGGDIVAGSLASLGYDCRWDTLSAADVGANHRRERWWLLAHAAGDDWAGLSIGASKEISIIRKPSDVADPKCERWRPEGHATSREAFGGWASAVIERSSWWSIEPDLGRVANGIPRRVDRLRALGNSVVPAQAREAFERLMGLK